MKLILDTENSHPTTITVKGKEITLLLIESSILIDSNQIAKIFDKKEKTVAAKVQKSKPRPLYDLRQMIEGPAYYYFKKEDEIDLIEVIIRIAIGKHREWIHNRNIDRF